METTYALNENEILQEIKRPPRIGFIKTFAGTTPPEGTLLCDGSAVSRDTYSELFAAIGTTWGSGDGANTFNLPDLRDVWILCAGTEHEAGDSVAEGLPEIEGKVNFRQIKGNTTLLSPQIYANNAFTLISGQTGVFADYVQDAAGTAGQTYPGNVLHFSASASSPIYQDGAHVTPKSTVLTPCIVYE